MEGQEGLLDRIVNRDSSDEEDHDVLSPDGSLTKIWS